MLSRLLKPDQLMSFNIMDTYNSFLDQSQIQQHRPERNRAWRRKTNYLHRGRDCQHTVTLWKPEKKFKYMAGRPFKLKRAMRLGFEYPRISPQQRKLRAQQDFWNHPD